MGSKGSGSAVLQHWLWTYKMGMGSSGCSRLRVWWSRQCEGVRSRWCKGPADVGKLRDVGGVGYSFIALHVDISGSDWVLLELGMSFDKSLLLLPFHCENVTSVSLFTFHFMVLF